jgi:SAM-dependent methyltransferase
MVSLKIEPSKRISFSDVESHLRACYKGVLSDAEIKLHLQDYVIGNGLEELQLDEVVPCLKPGGKLLDVGAGYGGFVLAARKAGYQAEGIDLADFEVSFARQSLEEVEPDVNPADVFHHGSGLDLPFPDKSFDAVTLWNFLEHVPDYRGALKEAARVLRPGGHLFALAPNYLALRSEAHYHVFWPSLIPKPLGIIYLRLRGKNPEFFRDNIHYCTNWGVFDIACESGLRLVVPGVEKIAAPDRIKNPFVRRAVKFAQACGISFLVRGGMFLRHRNPMSAVIHVHAVKVDAG